MKDDLHALLGQSSLPSSLLGDLKAVLDEEQEEENLSIKRGDRGTDKKRSATDFFDEEGEDDEEEDEEGEGGERKKNDGPPELPHKKRKKETRAAMNDLLGPDMDEITAVANKRKKPKKKPAKKKKKSPLTPAQDTLMQEATNAYIDGKFKQAVTILLNLIKEAPKVSLLYQQLGAIYEATGDMQKALDLFIIAATLGPRDVDQWRALARQAQEAELLPQALHCFDKIIRFEPEDVDARFERAMIHSQTGEVTKAIDGFKHVLTLFPDQTQVMKELAETYHSAGQTTKAINLLEGYMNKFRQPKKTKKKIVEPLDLNIVNVLCELYQLEKRDADTISALELLNSVPFADSSAPPDEPPPTALPIDLVVRKGIAYLNLGNLAQAELLFAVLQEYEVAHYADLFVEVAEAFMANKHFDRALSYYDMLQAVHDGPGLWLRQAQCLRKTGTSQDDLKRCAELYEKVLDEEPQNIDARLALAGVLKELGEDDRALLVVSTKTQKTKRKKTPSSSRRGEREAEDEEEEEGEAAAASSSRKKKRKKRKSKAEEERVGLAEERRKDRKRREKRAQQSMDRLKEGLDVDEAIASNEALQVLLAKAELLEANHSDEEYLQACLPAIKASITKSEALLVEEEEEPPASETAGPKSVIKARRRVRASSSGPHPARRLLGTAAFLDLIRKTINALCRQNRNQEASDLVIQTEGWGSSKNLVQMVQPEALDVLEEIRCLAPAILFKVGDYEGAYRFARSVVVQNPHSFKIVYLFNRIIAKLQFHTKCVRFLERAVVKFPDSAPLRILMGHCFLMLQNYAFALDQYGHVFRDPRYSQNPTVSLFMGIAALHKAMLRRTTDRHHSLMRACAFFHVYYRMSNEAPEAAYNVARMYHFLGLTAFAIQYYNKVLMHAGGLQREAAHNLANIYIQSGSLDLARRLYQEYCTI